VVRRSGRIARDSLLLICCVGVLVETRWGSMLSLRKASCVVVGLAMWIWGSLLKELLLLLTVVLYW
jgi:hypothetical protein